MKSCGLSTLPFSGKILGYKINARAEHFHLVLCLSVCLHYTHSDGLITLYSETILGLNLEILDNLTLKFVTFIIISMTLMI